MDERCENCKFFCKLNLFARYIETIGGMGYVSGWKVGTLYSKFNGSHGCSVFLMDSGKIHEVLPNDRCELFQPKEKENENHGEK